MVDQHLAGGEPNPQILRTQPHWALFFRAYSRLYTAILPCRYVRSTVDGGTGPKTEDRRPSEERVTTVRIRFAKFVAAIITIKQNTTAQTDGWRT
jgi:hypothetical protein